MVETKKPQTEATESRLLVQYAFDLSKELGVSKLLVLADLLQDRRTVEKHRGEQHIIWVSRGEVPVGLEEQKKGDFSIQIPEGEVDRMDQVKMGLMMAVLNNAITREESVVCLTGVAGSKRLDNLLIANVSRDFPWFDGDLGGAVNSLLASREFARLIEIALKFASEGREGKSLGTIFVLGEEEQLKTYLRPLILNPLKGHLRRDRSIHNPEFLESMRELAALDGAFIINPRGVVERAGVYLDARLPKKVKIPKGLGARHTAAAAIAAQTASVAVVISESSKVVSVFSGGAMVLQLNSSGSSTLSGSPATT